jgi:hypothetical protein
VTGCRIVRLAYVRGRPVTPLTAACGWTDTVVQGVEWERDPARERWAGHVCVAEGKVPA